MKLSILASAALAAGAAAHPNIFLIRHGEKNPDGTISAQGMEREQCLVGLFGRDSQFDIQKIIVQNPHPGDNLSQRPYSTTLPLARSLGLTIEHRCEYDDAECAANEARAYRGRGNILMAWEHKMLTRVVGGSGRRSGKVPRQAI